MEYLNEHEITKKMLSTIRKPRLNENARNNDEQDLTSTELSEEQSNFRSAVTPRVDFTEFKVYPNTKNVVFSGKFENMGGLEWQFTLEDADGLYISCENVPISDDSITTLKKLKGYYNNWADDWAKKLATEYQRDEPNNTENEINSQENNLE
jgi:hypothetical protein